MRNPKRLHLKALRPYEDRLLAALAFFRFNRAVTTQAHHALSMYLRQAESRIMSEVNFYSRYCDCDPKELLELIYQEPDKVKKMIEDAFSSSEPLGVDDPLTDDSDSADENLEV